MRRNTGHMGRQHTAQALQRTPPTYRKMRRQPVNRMNRWESIRLKEIEPILQLQAALVDYTV
jgi:hypothetical protein